MAGKNYCSTCVHMCDWRMVKLALYEKAQCDVYVVHQCRWSVGLHGMLTVFFTGRQQVSLGKQQFGVCKIKIYSV